jgi:hypothetical protein
LLAGLLGGDHISKWANYAAGVVIAVKERLAILDGVSVEKIASNAGCADSGVSLTATRARKGTVGSTSVVGGQIVP